MFVSVVWDVNEGREMFVLKLFVFFVVVFGADNNPAFQTCI